MAVECLEEKWAISYPVHGIPGWRWFHVHPLHDVESIFWLFLWFLHSRVPWVVLQLLSEKGAEETKRLRDSISLHSRKYFSEDASGMSRLGVLQNPLDGVYQSDFFAQFYSPCIYLLKPLALVESLRSEYVFIHQHPPEEGNDGTWRLPIKVFTDRIYKQFAEHLQQVLKDIGNNPILVQDIDTVARSDKPQAQAPSKRRRDTASDEPEKSSRSVQPGRPKKRALDRPQQASRNPTRARPPIAPKTSATARSGTSKKRATKK